MFRLALALGMSVAELGRRVSGAELTEWMAFFDLEPWGYDIRSWYFAMLAAVIANVHRGRDVPPYTPEDFLPRRETKHVQRDWQDLKRVAHMWAALYGAVK